VLALFVVACGGGTVTVDPQTQGTLQLPLVSSTADGTAYRLVGATFNITGTQTVTLTDTSTDTVGTPLLAGTYSIELAGGWTMERVGAPGTAVPATLVSPNPLPFVVTKGALTVVRFQFKLPGTGGADVGIVVDSGGWLAGTLHFTERIGPPGVSSGWDELVGKSVPFLISYDSATYIRNPGSWKELRVETGPVNVQFGGPHSAQLQRAAVSLKGSRLFYALGQAGPVGIMRFEGMFIGLSPSGVEPYRFRMEASGAFEGAVDEEGYPALHTFEFETPEVSLTDSYGYEGVRGSASVNGTP
jgi:hypothetical protein